MSDYAPRVRFSHTLYPVLLRVSGWLGLLFVLLGAFAISMGALLPQISWVMLGAGIVPGILVSLFLAGTPARPTMLLRPTSFLKGFFVCGFFLSMANTAIAVQIFFIVASLDTEMLLAVAGYPTLTQDIMQMLTAVYGPGIVIAAQPSFWIDVIVASALMVPGSLIINIASLMAWFIRFEKTVTPPMPTRANDLRKGYDDEKARAYRAMRQRQLARQAT